VSHDDVLLAYLELVVLDVESQRSAPGARDDGCLHGDVPARHGASTLVAWTAEGAGHLARARPALGARRGRLRSAGPGRRRSRRGRQQARPMLRRVTGASSTSHTQRGRLGRPSPLAATAQTYRARRFQKEVRRC
jgi:hypothetical protein